MSIELQMISSAQISGGKATESRLVSSPFLMEPEPALGLGY
jgi:hypothetical protein